MAQNQTQAQSAPHLYQVVFVPKPNQTVTTEILCFTVVKKLKYLTFCWFAKKSTMPTFIWGLGCLESHVTDLSRLSKKLCKTFLTFVKKNPKQIYQVWYILVYSMHTTFTLGLCKLAKRPIYALEKIEN